MSRKRPVRLVLVLPLLATLLAACASNPAGPSVQYLLPGAAQSALRGELPDIRLDTAGYLDQSGVVMQTSAVEVRAARQHQWAEPLPRQLARSLAARLARAGVAAPGRLEVLVTRFQGTAEGEAVIEGQWRFLGDQGDRAGTHFLERRPLRRDGYPALVEQLDEGWNAVADGIANGLTGATR